MTESKTDLPLTGQCFCGASTIVATQRPETVVYCHCIDCRRATGAPITAFAAFDAGAVTFTPNEGKSVSVVKGAARSFCEGCGSSLSGRYDYLPGQVYIPIGLFDQADTLAPQVHAHTSAAVPWLHVEDDLPRFDQSARTQLNAQSTE